MKILFVFSAENKTSLLDDVSISASALLTEDSEPGGGGGRGPDPVGGCADVGALVLAGHRGQHEARGVLHSFPVTQKSSALELASDQNRSFKQKLML